MKRIGLFNQPRRRSEKPTSSTLLTEAELTEFRLRHAALLQAQTHFTMVGEAYRAWLHIIGEKYGVGTLFSISAEDGTLVKQERVEGEELNG